MVEIFGEVSESLDARYFAAVHLTCSAWRFGPANTAVEALINHSLRSGDDRQVLVWRFLERFLLSKSLLD